MYSSLRNSLAALVLTAFAPVAFALENLATLFPEDTVLVAIVRDVRALEKLDEHGVLKTIATPEVKKVFAPMLSHWKEDMEELEKFWKEESGLSVEELRALFTGGAAIGAALDIEAFGAFMEQPKGERKFPKDAGDGWIVADFAGDDAKAEKVINAYMRVGAGEELKGGEKAPTFPDDFRYESAEVRGVKLHIWTPKEADKYQSFAWALSDKVLLLANGEKQLRQTLDRLQDGAPSLVKSPAFAELASRFDESDIAGYVHVQPLLKKAFDFAAKSFQGNQAGNPILFQGFIESLGLDRIESVYGTMGTKKDVLDVELGITFREKPEVFKIFATTGPGAVPTFLAPDHTNAGYGTFDWGQCLAAIEGIMEKAAPPARVMLDMQVEHLRKQTGVDLKKDLLGNLGANYWSVSATGDKKLSKALDEEEEEEALALASEDPQVIAFALKNKKAFELALTSLLNFAAPGEGLLEKSNYQDFELNQFKPVPIPLIYVLTDDWFIFSLGERSLLEKVLTNLKKGNREDHLFAQPHVAASVRALPGGSHGVTYTDFGDLLNAFAGLARELPAETLKEVVDIQALPDHLNIPIALSSGIYNEDRALRVRLHVEQKAQP